MYEELALFIDGEWCQGSTGESEEVINPATEKTLGVLPHGSHQDLDRALAAAERGFRAWRAVTPLERGKIIRRVGDLIREHAERIARIMTLEQGKTLHESLIEVLITADSYDWAAEEGKRAYGRIIPSRFPGTRMMTTYEPIGPVAAFAPWNFPALMPGRKIATALAAGCSVIVKPAEETPGTAIAIARLCEEAGVPKGVVNVVFGVPAQVSEHLISSPVIRKISFTGSIPVGKHLAKMAADGMKKVTMELGGHSPVVVFDDVDVDHVVQMTAAGKYRNAGQVCISPTRFYIHEDVYDGYVEKFVETFKNLKVGNGLDDGTQMGPMANPRRIEAMDDFVADARDRGATVHCGGQRIGNQGFYFAPTVMTDVPDDAKIMQIEPFGPLVPIVPFQTFDEVVERANSLPYGLAAYAFTGSHGRAMDVADALESGMVAINSMIVASPETPFGGIKESGIGREAACEGVLDHMSIKTISHTGM
jgi:succinate-semialdehyde dehydrogenase/glutarate-semialdehyde dehydrogenase